MPIMERVARRASSLAERLDSFVDAIDPERGARRKAFRAASEALGYASGKKTRTRADIPSGGRADFHLDSTRWSSIEVARRLERDSVLAESLLARSVENTVGEGFGHKACTGSDPWNEECEALWKDWASGPCDVRGLSTLAELTRLTARGRLRDGDQGTILLPGYKLQQVEADQIVSPSRSHVNTRRMVDGVELDRRGAPVAFHVVDNPDPMLPSVRYANRVTRIPAESFIFTAKRTRHGQTRGMSSLAKAAWLIEQVGGNIEAVTVASRMAACVGLVIQRDKRMSGLPEDEEGRRRLKLQPGFIAEINQGDSVTQVSQTQPGTDWPNYLAALLRLVALEFGLPLEIGFLDVSRSNYTNLRAAFLQAQKTWRIEQQALEAWLSRIYRWRVLGWIKEGRLAPRPDAFRHIWTPTPWTWVDPAKELTAKLAECDAGLNSRTRVALERGRDLNDLIAEQKRERAAFEAAGLPVVRSQLTRDPLPEPAEVEAPEVPEEDPEGEED